MVASKRWITNDGFKMMDYKWWLQNDGLQMMASKCWQTSKEITKGVDKTQETPRTFCPLGYLAFCVGAFCPVCWRSCADPGP